MNDSVRLIALRDMPLVHAGDAVAAHIILSLGRSGIDLQDDDIVVVAQKIVSKAEGRMVRLTDVSPSAHAIEIAEKCDKSPELVELILSEATEIMRLRKGVIIVRHRLGLVLANAGIDQSNIDHDGGPAALLLPVDPDASAARIREALKTATGKTVAVLIIDSLGRAWRQGTIGTAIGVAGMTALLDLRGREDLHGRKLETSELGLADEVAAAASLVMGQADEGTPVVLIRGLAPEPGGRASDLIRPKAMDLFP